MKLRIACLASLLLLFTACSTKTERELYEDASSGITYSTYKAASKLTIGASVKAYNFQQKEDSLDLDPVYAHLLLGYFWSVSGKSTLSFAESDIVEEDEDSKLKFLAQSMRAITMYQEGWQTLAKEESEKAQAGISKDPNTDITYEAAVFYLIMGTVLAKEKDFAQASFYWAGFGNETGIHWPYQICDAAADFQAGRTQQGLQKIKVVSQDPAVPQPLREAFRIEIEKIEKAAGTSVDSSLFWPKLIGKLLWNELQNSKDAGMQKLTGLVNEAQKKLPS